jgi:hypothetical protein
VKKAKKLEPAKSLTKQAPLTTFIRSR